MRTNWIVMLAATMGLATMVVSHGLLAQQPKSSVKAPATKKSSPDVQYRADRLDGLWADEKKVRLQGAVTLTHEDTVIASEQIDYDGGAMTAVSPGATKITNPDCDIKGDKGSAYFRKKLGVLEGNVVMLLKPKPAEPGSSSKDSIDKFKEPTTVTCEKIEYFYAKRLASAQGKVVFKQAKRTGYADKAVYDQKKELLTLTGHVRMVDEDGQTLGTPGVMEVSLKKGAESMKLPKEATGTFKVDTTDEEDQNP